MDDLPLRPVPQLSPEQQLIRDQYDALLRGEHPLSVPLDRELPLHPDAASPDDPTAPGKRCAGCALRDRDKIHAWWPACDQYHPRLPAPDATQCPGTAL